MNTQALTHGLPHVSRSLSVNTLWSALTLMKSRRALAALTPAQLQDLGLTEKQAEQEAKRPFWDAPEWWNKIC